MWALTYGASVPDGGTLILGQAIVEEAVKTSSGTRILTDLPTTGRVFRTLTKKHRMALITPTMIDTAGNRIPEEPTPPEPSKTASPPVK